MSSIELFCQPCRISGPPIVAFSARLQRAGPCSPALCHPAESNHANVTSTRHMCTTTTSPLFSRPTIFYQRRRLRIAPLRSSDRDPYERSYAATPVSLVTWQRESCSKVVMAVPAAPPKSSTPKPSSHSRTTSQASSRNYAASAPVSRRAPRSTAPDYLSDKATAAFIRRTLCPQQNGDAGRNAAAPIEELLPPLTSRNDVDLQLYAFLAVILKEFVQAWYSKITPDETFVAEIVQIIAHCTRAVEQRLRKVDLESLLLDEIPDLLDRHITGTAISLPWRTPLLLAKLLIIRSFPFSSSCRPESNSATTDRGSPARGLSLPLPTPLPLSRPYPG